MSLPKREFQRPAGLPITVDELYGIMRLRAFKSSGFPVNILAENDGTVRSQVILYDGTTQTRGRSETNGSLITSLYGKNAGTLTSVNLESTGEQRNVLMGHDGSALQRLLVDADKKLWVRITEDTGDDDDPVTLSNAADTTVYTCAAGFTAIVEIELTNVSAATATVDLYCDPTGTDVTTAFQILNDTPIIVNAEPRRYGPYNLSAGGTVRGRASAATAINARVFTKLIRTT